MVALVQGRLRGRKVAALLASFLLLFGLALGGDAPLFPALWSLPGLDGLRYPQRFLAPCSLLLAALAAVGRKFGRCWSDRRGPDRVAQSRPGRA